jgi:hypothetical protein
MAQSLGCRPNRRGAKCWIRNAEYFRDSDHWFRSRIIPADQYGWNFFGSRGELRGICDFYADS